MDAPMPRRRGWIEPFSLLLGVIAAVAVVFPLATNPGYRAGRHNVDDTGAFTALFFLAVTFVCALLLFINTLWLARSRDRRGFFAAAMLVIAVAGLAIRYAVAEYGGDPYERGLMDWAKHDVPTDAIRTWHATLAPVATATPLPPTAWPAQIIALGPVSVEQLPAGGGVVMQWGRLAAWGTSRKLFIGPGATALPPDDPHHLWTSVAPGVYVGVQIPG